MEGVFRGEDRVAARMRSAKLDGRFDGLAPRRTEKNFLGSSAGSFAKLLRKLPRKARNMTLDHGRPASFKFFLECANYFRVVMPHVVHAVSRKKVENTAPVRGKQLRSPAALVPDVHRPEAAPIADLRVPRNAMRRLKRTIQLPYS